MARGVVPVRDVFQRIRDAPEAGLERADLVCLKFSFLLASDGLPRRSCRSLWAVCSFVVWSARSLRAMLREAWLAVSAAFVVPS
jgi:hypothetical protein